ncbi:hypothetical protein [Streptomyces sp. NPDC093568]|uniref:hypothetical protein n=1 Tax=Streptomyces sp. NPDC093568 TaxID=3366041 RepID=UPI00382F5360
MATKAYRLLKAIMETAVDDELITRNPGWITGSRGPVNSDDDRQQEVAAGLDATVHKARQEAAVVPGRPTADPGDQRSGTNLARDD